MLKLKKIKRNKNFFLKISTGMSYVELIVVISIMSILIAISLLNYTAIQEKVQMKNLANDMGLKIIEAQKTAISGKMPLSTDIYSDYEDGWRPSYGIYFNLEENYNDPEEGNYPGKKVFYYFVDLDQRQGERGLKNIDDCVLKTGECIDVYIIKKTDYISEIVLFDNNGDVVFNTHKGINIVYTRPNQSAFFYDENGQKIGDVDSMEILLKNENESTTSSIKVFSSGRVQIN